MCRDLHRENRDRWKIHTNTICNKERMPDAKEHVKPVRNYRNQAQLLSSGNCHVNWLSISSLAIKSLRKSCFAHSRISSLCRRLFSPSRLYVTYLHTQSSCQASSGKLSYFICERGAERSDTSLRALCRSAEECMHNCTDSLLAASMLINRRNIISRATVL